MSLSSGLDSLASPGPIRNFLPTEDTLCDPLLPLDTIEENEEDPRGNSEPFKVRSNIRRILALTWFAFTAKAIWSQSVLSIFVYLMNSTYPERIGYMTAVMGLSQLATSFPAQHLVAKSWSRCRLLQFASVLGTIATAVTVYSTLIHSSFSFLLVALSVWGTMWSFTDVALPSLFGDSLTEQNQDMLLKRASRVIRSSNVVGPMVVFVFFYIHGDSWTTQNCALVITLGLTFSFPVLLLLCCLWETEDFDTTPSDLDIEVLTTSEKMDITGSTDALDSLMGNSQELSSETSANSHGRTCCDKGSLIGGLISVSNILSSIASGISIRYFAIFLVSKLQLSPTQVQLLNMVTPLCQAGVKVAAQSLACYCGAPFVVIVLHLSYVATLGGMVISYHLDASRIAVCALFLGLGVLQNSTGALTRAIVASAGEEQSNPSSVIERLQLLLWSAGGAVGGYLVGSFGLAFCFYVTAALQFVAVIPVVAVFFVLICDRGEVTSLSEEEYLFRDENPVNTSSETLFEESQQVFDDSDSAEYFDTLTRGGSSHSSDLSFRRMSI